MTLMERIALTAMHRIDPEAAHGLAITALRRGLTPRAAPVTSDRLKTSVAGLSLPNPVGLAAGFDKNATAVAPLLQSGFGFIEVGAATPLPQPGNPKPRLFRLTPDRAAINRFGFNNDGVDAIAKRLAGRPQTGIVGLNLGANKTSEDRAADYGRVLAKAGQYVDFVTVNVSSPNTEKLRDLQGKAALTALLQGAMDVRADQKLNLPIFLKIAPDLGEAEIGEIAEVALETKVDAVIATNTTLDRTGLQDAQRDQAGGLSGAPLFKKSTQVLARLSRITNGDLPLIGVGGISNAEQAYLKILAGASAVQLYTALVFGGLSMVSDIVRGLDELLASDGYANVAEAVGQDRDRFL